MLGVAPELLSIPCGVIPGLLGGDTFFVMHDDARQSGAAVCMRLAASVLMFLLAAFCAYGFLASFEFPGVTLWKIGYATLATGFGLAGLAIIRSIWRAARNARSGSR